MYIEPWQFYVVITAVVSAYFSYRQGRIEGVTAGVQITITDLHSKGIVAIYHDNLAGEMVVGRYDEDDWEETTELGEDYDDEEHY